MNKYFIRFKAQFRTYNRDKFMYLDTSVESIIIFETGDYGFGSIDDFITAIDSKAKFDFLNYHKSWWKYDKCLEILLINKL